MRSILIILVGAVIIALGIHYFSGMPQGKSAAAQAQETAPAAGDQQQTSQNQQALDATEAYFREAQATTTADPSDGIVALPHHMGFSSEPAADQLDKNVKLFSVLFIGDIYTYNNNMPDMLQQISKSDQGSDFIFEVAAIGEIETDLKQHWRDRAVHGAIKSRDWDRVVIQENAKWIETPETINDSARYATYFHKRIVENSSTPLLFGVWAYQQDSERYKGKKNQEAFQNYDFMQKSLSYYTAFLGSQLKARYLLVGDYWYYLMQYDPTLNLYSKDGASPNILGSYVTALVFYKEFTGRSPEFVTYTPRGIPPARAEQVRKMLTHAMGAAAANNNAAADKPAATEKRKGP